MAAFDPSHDWHHVDRVRRTALSIASQLVSDGAAIDMLVLELAALFHDLYDSKYTDGPSATSNLNTFFDLHAAAIPAARRGLVLRIVDNVSFSKEMKRRASGGDTDWHKTCLELHW